MKKSIETFIVDSFTGQPFKGNPAGVCICDTQIESETMQCIAKELNLSETAFLVGNLKEASWAIRYFSTKMEIPLCGHATLASSKVLFEKLSTKNIEFVTGEGLSLFAQENSGKIEMEFPVYDLHPASATTELLDAIGIDSVLYCGFNQETKILMLEIESCGLLRNLRPDFLALQESHDSINGVLITAEANGHFDFYSRYFWPWSGGMEDPVTGGTHTFLAKYWGDKLQKNVMQSFQASERTGEMEVELANGKLLIRGEAVIVLDGRMRI